MVKRQHTLHICASKPLAIVLGCLAAIATALAGFYLPIWPAIACASVALGSGFWAIGTHALGSTNHCITTLRFSSRGSEVELQDGKWVEVKAVRGSFVHPLLTIIVLALGPSVKACGVLVIVPGRVDKDDFRLLRVWVKWQVVEWKSA